MTELLLHIFRGPRPGNRLYAALWLGMILSSALALLTTHHAPISAVFMGAFLTLLGVTAILYRPRS